MDDTHTITVRLFGAFRNYSSEESITLKLASNSTVEDVRTSIATFFQKNTENFDCKLIEESVIATDDQILDPQATLLPNAKLAILPPVCGG